MIYIIIPFALFLLVVFQNLLADILFLGRSTLEISLLVVIYLAFRVNLMKGVLVSSFLGFLMDGVVGTISGTHIFIYFIVFSGSYYISRHLYGEGDWFIVVLVLFWGVVEAFTLLLFKFLPTGYFSFIAWVKLLFPQIIPLCVLGPFVFRIFDRWEFLYVLYERSHERP